MSVMKALPLVKSRPPTAGRSAKASGEECQCEDSSSTGRRVSIPSPGRTYSPADDCIDWRVSLA